MTDPLKDAIDELHQRLPAFRERDELVVATSIRIALGMIGEGRGAEFTASLGEIAEQRIAAIRSGR